MKRQMGKAPKPKSEPLLKTKQLKSVLYLIAASCHIDSGLITGQYSELRQISEKYYHGDGEDVLGKAQDFLLGKFRFEGL